MFKKPTMRALQTFTFVSTLSLLVQHALAENYLNHHADANGWETSLNIEAYAWALDGSFTNIGKLTQNTASSFSGTGESLELPTENVAQFTAIASNRKWTLSLFKLSLNTQGEGIGLAAVASGNVGGFIAVDVTSDIDIDFSVAEVSYNLVATDNASLSLGAAAGKLEVGMDFLVNNGAGFSYDDSTPFGYVTLNMANKHGPIFYGFSVNGLRFSGKNQSEEEIDYKVKFAYRHMVGALPVDFRWGWRHMNLKFEIENNTGSTKADIELKGPYLGLGTSF